MRISARTEYALRALLEMAQVPGEGLIQVRTIAQRQGIPARFLEQVMASLRKAGLVEGLRGAQGGYRLTRPPSLMTLAEVVEAVEGAVQTPERMGDGHGGEAVLQEVLREVWEEAREALLAFLRTVTLEELLHRKASREQQQVVMYHI